MPDQSIDLTKGLRTWAEQNEVTPAQFAEKTGYKYSYAWDLLRGRGTFTQESLGRFVFAYGLEAVADVLRLAGAKDEALTLPSPKGRGGKSEGGSRRSLAA